MSEQQVPDRTIRGFGVARSGGGVHPDASRLLARNRVAPADQPAATHSTVAADAQARPATIDPPTVLAAPAHAIPSRLGRLETDGLSPAVDEASQSAAHAPEAANPPPGVKAQVNVMVPSDLRARIRSAYRATSVQEGHRSFSDFVATLLESEAVRLEGRYNGGQRFSGGQQPLPPGRPLDN